MKNLTILSLFLLSLVSLNSIAQDKKLAKKEVPEFINSFLQKNYPEAKDIHFYSEMVNQQKLIEAEFKFKKIKYSLLFDNEKLIETETHISFNELDSLTQKMIRSHLDSNIHKYRIEECNLIHTTNGKFIEVEIETREKEEVIEKEYTFNEKGEVVNYKIVDFHPITTPY